MICERCGKPIYDGDTEETINMNDGTSRILCLTCYGKVTEQQEPTGENLYI